MAEKQIHRSGLNNSPKVKLLTQENFNNEEDTLGVICFDQHAFAVLYDSKSKSALLADGINIAIKEQEVLLQQILQRRENIRI